MYSLRKIAAVATVGLSLALPVAAHANSDTSCGGSNVQSNQLGNVTQTPSADTLGRICVDGTGYIAVGTDGNGHVFVVGENDDLGYVGVSNYESGAKSPCGPTDPDGNEGGTGTNSGGCYGTNNNAVQAPLPLVCGDNTGPWYGSSRDGCRSDQEDVNDVVDTILGLL